MIIIDKEFISPLLDKASQSKRRRTNYNFHKYDGDNLQRMLNIMNTGTYVQPHKHENPDKREAFIILKGKVAIVEFDDNGNPTESIILEANTNNYGCEIAARTWHTIICLEDNSVVYEIKDGPYNALTDKNFAFWAPVEGEIGTEEYNRKLLEKLKLIEQ
jgi:cupin fold WbuC family metalloprotein